MVLLRWLQLMTSQRADRERINGRGGGVGRGLGVGANLGVGLGLGVGVVVAVAVAVGVPVAVAVAVAVGVAVAVDVAVGVAVAVGVPVAVGVGVGVDVAVGLDVGVGVGLEPGSPPSAVQRIVPLSPTTMPLNASFAKETSLRVADVPLIWSVQLIPASVLCEIRPPPPTANPLIGCAKSIPWIT